MGFFKKNRKGGKISEGFVKGKGIKGMDKSIGGYTFYSSEKQDGAPKDKKLPGRLK